MSNKSTNHNAKPTLPPNPIPGGERVPTEGLLYGERSVPKTIVLPSAQAPAEPPKAAPPSPKPSQSDAKEK